MPIGVRRRLTGPTRKKFFRPTSRLASCSSQLNSACAQNYMGITHMTPEQHMCNNMLRIALLSSGLTEVVLSFFRGPAGRTGRTGPAPGRKNSIVDLPRRFFDCQKSSLFQNAIPPTQNLSYIHFKKAPKAWCRTRFQRNSAHLQLFCTKLTASSAIEIDCRF